MRQCSSGANVSTINLVFEVTNLKARTESGARSTIFDKGASIVAMQELGAVIGMWLHSTGTWRTPRLQWLLLQARRTSRVHRILTLLTRHTALEVACLTRHTEYRARGTALDNRSPISAVYIAMTVIGIWFQSSKIRRTGRIAVKSRRAVPVAVR